MPVYKINTPLTSPANLEVVADALKVLAAHAAAQSFTVSSPSIGTGGDAGKLRLTISKTLTTAEQSHLGVAS